MSLKKFKKIAVNKVKDLALSKIQDNIEQVLEPIINSPIIPGILLRDICLEPGCSNEIEHKLGRKPLGWVIVRKRSGAIIWDLQDTNPQPSLTLSIVTDSSVKIDIWVF